MLKSIHIINFQGHKDSLLEFNPKFNVIIGDSDKGKSSIVRAEEWVRTNRPKGLDTILRHGATEVKVIVTTESSVIERKRTKKDTGSYSLNEETFSIMGGDVPLPVQNALNIEDINIQLQLDGHFLILETPGKAASLINRITKLDKIDTALSKLKSMKMASNREFIELNDSLVEVNDYLESGIKDVFIELEKIKDNVILKSTERNFIYQKVSNLTNVVEQLISLKDEVKEIIKISNAKSEMKKIRIRIDEYSDLGVDFRQVGKRVNELEGLNDRFVSINKNIDSLAKEKEAIELQLENCPYCGNRLDNKSRNKVLGIER